MRFYIVTLKMTSGTAVYAVVAEKKKEAIKTLKGKDKIIDIERIRKGNRIIHFQANIPKIDTIEG